MYKFTFQKDQIKIIETNFVNISYTLDTSSLILIKNSYSIELISTNFLNIQSN